MRLFDRLFPSIRILKDTVQSLAAAVSRQSEEIKQLTAAVSLRADQEREVPVTPVTLSNQLAETRNLLEHIVSQLGTVREEAKNAVAHDRPALKQLVSQSQWKIIGEINALACLVLANSAENRPVQHLADNGTGSSAYRPARPEPFEATLARAHDLEPQMYPHWHDRLLAVKEQFSISKFGNAANALDPYSHSFRDWVRCYASGRLLDVGCGVFGLPFYLEGYPPNLFSGLDPLQPVEPVGFELIQGLSEYLPWPDASFDTVVSATSLDHALSLDRSLDEIKRVCRPGGKVLLWVASIPGSPPYRPRAADYIPADQWHLFHFDTAWFDPLLAQKFRIARKVVLPTEPFDHVYYVLEVQNAVDTSGTKP